MSSSMLSQGGIGSGPYLDSGSLPPPPMLRPPPLTRTSALANPEPYQLDYGHSYDLPSAGGAGGSHEINQSQLTPLSLTHEHSHRHNGSHHPNGLPHHHHHHHHHHLSEQPGIDPYQEYYQTTTRGFNPSAYDHMPPLSSSQDPRTNYNSGYHDYSVGGKNGTEVDPYFYASTPSASTSSVAAHQPSNLQYPRYLDEQSSSSLPPPTVAHPPPPPLVPGAPFHQHYQPSPAVLLHIRYVMESICEWMQFTDVSIVAGSSTFRAHRTILASHSTFLRQLLINNILDVGEGEEPCLILPGVSLNHMRLLMQFFYTGMVSLSGQEDIQPLKDVCCNLGISSLMARLEELSFSLQCLPNYQEPFKYSQPMASSSSVLPREADLPNEVEPAVADALIQQPCKDHPQAPESIHDASFDSGPAVPYPPANDIVVTAVDQGEKQMLDEATSNFDTSLLNVDLPRSTATLKIEADCGRVKKKAYGCSECSAKFYDLEGLKAHERVHKGQRPFLCSICDVASATKHHLIVHMRKHSGEKPFICDICKKAFADRSAYRRHKTIHETRKTFQCETCKKEFSDQSTYKRHQREKHGSKDKKFQCKICEKEFNRKETFVSHVTHVHGVDIKKASTDTDPKATHQNQSQTKEKLKQYLSEDSVKKLDQNVRKWSSIKCPECKMIFYKRSAMEIHLRSHTGHKPFVCDVCDKRFGRSNNLKLHQRIHSGEKPYKCSEHDCGKAFSDISAFKRHVRTHSGVKPYKCDKCQRAFAQTGTMMNHKKHCNGPPSGASGACSAAALPILVHKSNLSSPTTLGDEGVVGGKPAKRLFAMTSSNYPHEANNGQVQHEFLVNSITEDNSLSVMAGSEPPGLNTDTLDSVRASCL